MRNLPREQFSSDKFHLFYFCSLRLSRRRLLPLGLRMDLLDLGSFELNTVVAINARSEELGTRNGHVVEIGVAHANY